MNLSQASIPASFCKTAAQCGVTESDFLYLSHMGIHTHDALALRVHSKDALESFLRDHICPSAAYSHPDRGLLIFNRTPQVPWREFSLSEDAAAIRKLWLLSHEMCKAEVEKMASGEDSTKSRVKLSSHVAMEEAAKTKGLPQPSSDAERPSLYCLNRMAKCFLGPGASHEYLSWEVYISLEEEDRMARAGIMPKPRGEISLNKESKITVSSKDDEDPPVDHVSDLESLRQRLEIRARASAMLEVASYSTYRSLSDRYVGKILAHVPEGMRQPTVAEVRRFDRMLHQEVLRWVARDVGTVDAGIQYHLDRDEVPIWRLLDPVIKTLPDQGVEKGGRGKKRKQEDMQEKDRAGSPKPLERKPADRSRMKQCLVCKKRHEPLCALPEDFRQKMRAERKAQKKAKAEAKAKQAPRREAN